MKRIWYHGTKDSVTALSILKTGFKPESWFAEHLEDALAYGGPHVLEVVLDIDHNHWQLCHAKAIPYERILSYSVYERDLIFSNEELRQRSFPNCHPHRSAEPDQAHDV